jgi:crotonobetainyl-CoA:carnitine CoA-transferase CaiB-like acyl-CoA transferase
VRMPGFPIRSNACLVSLHLPAPRPGAHSEDVLRRVLGYDHDLIRHLVEAGVVAPPPTEAPANPQAIRSI